MEYIDQVQNIKISEQTVTTTYLEWENTESGRNECTTYIVRHHSYGRSYHSARGKLNSIYPGNRFYDILEKMYLSVIDPSSKEILTK